MRGQAQDGRRARAEGEGWPPELATWEEDDDIPCGEVDFVADYEAALEAEAAAAAEAESDSEGDDE